MISRIHVGNDISKKWFDVYALVNGEEFCKRFPNTPQGHTAFIEAVRALALRAFVCMEYTGGFETALALACKEAGFVVSLVDGAKIANFRKSFGSAQHKTDRGSAKLLARYCKERRPAEWFPTPDEYRLLRELVRHRERLVETKTAWSSRSGYSAETEIVVAQRRSICEHLAIQIKDIEKAISAHIKAHAELDKAVELLRSIPGIAFKSAFRILAETGPIENYATAKAYALSAGLVPILSHSGKHTPPGKLAVYGNRELRCAFYFPVVVCLSHRRGVWHFMQRVAKNGTKIKMTIITAGMRKLAHIVFGVLTAKQPFDQEKAIWKIAET